MIFLKWVSNKGGFMVSVLRKLSFPTLTISCMESLRNRKAKKFAGYFKNTFWEATGSQKAVHGVGERVGREIRAHRDSNPSSAFIKLHELGRATLVIPSLVWL